jgi:two-component system alkaline phosphatase synthesis response regulator PhoP
MNNPPLRVLIADDDADVREILSYNLRKENYEVHCTEDGWQAVSLAIKTQPDLIIMDVHMPWLSGIEACRMIKANKELKDTPVLFLTGDSDEYVSMIAIRAGGNHYITKPVYPDLLLRMIKKILQQQPLAINQNG